MSRAEQLIEKLAKEIREEIEREERSEAMNKALFGLLRDRQQVYIDRAKRFELIGEEKEEGNG